MKQIGLIQASVEIRWAVLALAVAAVLCGSRSASAQPGPPGQTLSDRLVAAHRDVQTAVVEVSYGLYYSRADETEFVTTEYRLAFDRPSKRLRIDRPGYTMVCDGVDILLVAEALPGRHLRMPLNGELTYERLVKVFPDLADPTPPALVYLLSKQPIAQFSGDAGGDATPLAPTSQAEAGHYHLAYPLGQGSHKQSFNGTTRLIEQVLIDLQVNAQDLKSARFHYAFDWSAVGEPVDDAEFELGLKQSQEMTTLAAFLSASGSGGQAGLGGQSGGAVPGGSLIGMALPEIELDLLGGEKTVKLSDLDKGVVVLECFATWSKTSVLDLPALADFKAWCEEKEHEVQVFAIAVGEQTEKMSKWMDALEKAGNREVDLPILMDTEAKAAMVMKLPTVPRTLIVVSGRIVDVYGGVKPTYLDDLKKGLPGWLEKGAASANEEGEAGTGGSRTDEAE